MLHEEIEASAAQVKSPAATTGKKVILFAREGGDFYVEPVSVVRALTPRPKMRPGNVPLKGNGTKEFAWFVFEHGHRGPCMISQLRHCPDECGRKDNFFEDEGHEY